MEQVFQLNSVTVFSASLYCKIMMLFPLDSHDAQSLITPNKYRKESNVHSLFKLLF